MEYRVEPLAGACKQYEEDLVLYYYGETGASEGVATERHLAQCPPCAKFVADLGRLLPQMAPKPELSQQFWDNYFRETVAKLDAQAERQNWWRRGTAPLNGWLVPAFGTMAVALLAFVLVLEKGYLPSATDSTATNIPAEVLVDSNQLEFFKSLDILESLSKLEEQDGAKLERKNSKLDQAGIA